MRELVRLAEDIGMEIHDRPRQTRLGTAVSSSTKTWASPSFKVRRNKFKFPFLPHPRLGESARVNKKKIYGSYKDILTSHCLLKKLCNAVVLTKVQPVLIFCQQQHIRDVVQLAD